MNRILLFVDGISTWVGKTFAWCILLLTFTTSYEVFARYMFGAPTDWAFDASYMLYGTLFMMAGAYTLSLNGHVCGDYLCRAWRPRVQATSDLILYVLFFFPGMLAFIYSGYSFAKLSYMMNEHSAASPDGPIVWPFKWLIPIVGCECGDRRGLSTTGPRRSRPLHHLHPHRRMAETAARCGGDRKNHTGGG